MDWNFSFYDSVIFSFNFFPLLFVFIPVVLIHFCATQKSLAQNTLAVILECGVFYSSALRLSKQRRDSASVIIASNLNSQQVTAKEITIFAVRRKIANHHHWWLASCSGWVSKGGTRRKLIISMYSLFNIKFPTSGFWNNHNLWMTM